uniref:G_PROTEIN_RECEP_F1_2 domain-containing protein n=1 Tax=Rhabditophanes sp. KR3021 TaxID=114890 RepID=A0AC35UHG9_9BILA
MNQEILTSTQLYPVSLASSEKILEILTDDQMLDIENEVSLLQQPFIRNFLIIAYIIVFLFCIVGNIIILLVIITKKSMRTVTNFLLANLAVADLLVGLFCICQTGFHFLYVDYSQWLFGKPMCHVYLYLINMMPTISSGILVLLSIERFIAVVRPMLVQDIMTGRVLIISTLLIWTISIITNLPYLLAVQYISHEDPINGVDMAICTRKFIKFYDYDVLKFVSIMNLIVWYFVPVILLLVIYISIGCVLANARKKHPYPSSSSRGKFEDKKQGMLHTMTLPLNIRRFIIFIFLFQTTNAQISEIAGLVTSILGGGSGLGSAVSAGAGAANGLGGGLSAIYQLAQTAMQLTGTGVNIANTASESQWFPILVEENSKNQKMLQERLYGVQLGTSTKSPDGTGNVYGRITIAPRTTTEKILPEEYGSKLEILKVTTEDPDVESGSEENKSKPTEEETTDGEDNIETTTDSVTDNEDLDEFGEKKIKGTKIEFNHETDVTKTDSKNKKGIADYEEDGEETESKKSVAPTLKKLMKILKESNLKEDEFMEIAKQLNIKSKKEPEIAKAKQLLPSTTTETISSWQSNYSNNKAPKTINVISSHVFENKQPSIQTPIVQPAVVQPAVVQQTFVKQTFVQPSTVQPSIDRTIMSRINFQTTTIKPIVYAKKTSAIVHPQQNRINQINHVNQVTQIDQIHSKPIEQTNPQRSQQVTQVIDNKQPYPSRNLQSVIPRGTPIEGTQIAGRHIYTSDMLINNQIKEIGGQNNALSRRAFAVVSPPIQEKPLPFTRNIATQIASQNGYQQNRNIYSGNQIPPSAVPPRHIQPSVRTNVIVSTTTPQPVIYQQQMNYQNRYPNGNQGSYYPYQQQQYNNNYNQNAYYQQPYQSTNNYYANQGNMWYGK